MTSRAIARSEDARTRQRVLAAVLDIGPVSASGVAKVMDLTAAAIRRHFDALEADGLIEVRKLAGTRTGRGRPARQYVVTSAGHEAISHTYDDLAVDVLGFVERRAGRGAVAEFAAEHAAELAALPVSATDRALSRGLQIALTAERHSPWRLRLESARAERERHLLERAQATSRGQRGRRTGTVREDPI